MADIFTVAEEGTMCLCTDHDPARCERLRYQYTAHTCGCTCHRSFVAVVAPPPPTPAPDAGPPGLDPEREAAIRARLVKAHEVVSDLCHGRRRWTMSVPAREDHDPDLLVGAALRDADALLAGLTATREALARCEGERDEIQRWRNEDTLRNTEALADLAQRAEAAERERDSERREREAVHDIWRRFREQLAAVIPGAEHWPMFQSAEAIVSRLQAAERERDEARRGTRCLCTHDCSPALNTCFRCTREEVIEALERADAAEARLRAVEGVYAAAFALDHAWRAMRHTDEVPEKVQALRDALARAARATPPAEAGRPWPKGDRE